MKLYVVRSADADPVHYAAFDSLGKAKEFIKRAEETEWAMENNYMLDYDIVDYFETVDEAMDKFEEDHS